MKRLSVFVLILVVILLAGFGYRQLKSQPNEKVYVAVEGESKIVAIDLATNKIVSTIDLAVEHDGGRLPYAPHNVQVSPDMQTVWVTANAGTHQGHSSRLLPQALAHGEEKVGSDADEVIIIDPKTDQIKKRLPLGTGLHLAHVSLTPDSAYAMVTAQIEGAIYKINTQTYEVEQKVMALAQEPHGLRLSSDGLTAYVAMLKGNSLGIFDLQTNKLSTLPLGGAAVQTGVTPDGKTVVASLYDTKQLAVYNVATKRVNKIALPSEAKGPIQMYPTPDSKFVYLADQGYYFNQPPSEWVYKIDLEKLAVVKNIKAGAAPHGVVVSPDGARVYITNLLSGDVSVIDTATDVEVQKIKVGKEPNGVSVWAKK